MSELKIYPARVTPECMPSVYGNTPEMRVYEHPEMVSVNVRDLFPEMPEAIYEGDDSDPDVIEKATRKALEKVDMSMIQPDETINLIGCEHGFYIFGGRPYIRMLQTIKKVVEERCHNYNVRLRCVMYRTPMEGKEVIDYYNLMEEFEGNVEYVAAYDKAVPIETRLGTVYGLHKCYDADRLIYANYDDPREVYCSLYYRRAFKAFTMDMARFETRNLYHHAFGSPVGHGPMQNIVPMSIYDSDFVQSKWAFAVTLRSTPAGITDIDADNSLYNIDDRMMADNLKWFPLMHQLLISLHDYTMICDGSRWPYYTAAAGIIAGVNTNLLQDHYDIDARFSMFDVRNLPKNEGLKAIIYNQTWVGINITWPMTLPVIVVGDEQFRMWCEDPNNKGFENWTYTEKTDNLQQALDRANELMNGSNKFVIYDGSFGFLNCSKEAAEELFENAPKIRKLVNEELYPKYMKQRGLQIPDYMK